MLINRVTNSWSVHTVVPSGAFRNATYTPVESAQNIPLLEKTGRRAECIVSLHFHFEKVLSIVSFYLKRKRSRRTMAFYNKFFKLSLEARILKD